MAAEKPKATNVLLGREKGKPVRLSHLHVFKPHLNTESNKEEYSVQLWIPKENKVDHQAAVDAFEEQKALYTKHEGKPGPEFHNPIKDGDKITDKKGNAKPVPGMWVVSAKTAAYEQDGTAVEPPQVAGTERGEKGELKLLTSAQVKSGDWGRASINFKFFPKGKGGVGVYLNSLQKTKDGEALGGGRRSAAAEFADFEDDDEDLLG
jgi:hypothetical protein